MHFFLIIDLKAISARLHPSINTALTYLRAATFSNNDPGCANNEARWDLASSGSRLKSTDTSPYQLGPRISPRSQPRAPNGSDTCSRDLKFAPSLDSDVIQEAQSQRLKSSPRNANLHTAFPSLSAAPVSSSAVSLSQPSSSSPPSVSLPGLARHENPQPKRSGTAKTSSSPSEVEWLVWDGKRSLRRGLMRKILGLRDLNMGAWDRRTASPVLRAIADSLLVETGVPKQHQEHQQHRQQLNQSRRRARASIAAQLTSGATRQQQCLTAKLQPHKESECGVCTACQKKNVIAPGIQLREEEEEEDKQIHCVQEANGKRGYVESERRAIAAALLARGSDNSYSRKENKTPDDAAARAASPMSPDKYTQRERMAVAKALLTERRLESSPPKKPGL
jgi:hypothetical protein